jgi:6-phosphogluconate dehydrogenase (decarboxylating)
MQLGMIRPGRLSANMVRRLMKDGHVRVAFDVNPGARRRAVRGQAPLGIREAFPATRSS